MQGTLRKAAVEKSRFRSLVYAALGAGACGGMLLAVRGTVPLSLPSPAGQGEPSAPGSQVPGELTGSSPSRTSDLLAAAFSTLQRGIVRGKFDSTPVAVATARWLSAWCTDGQRRQLALALGGDALVDWLVGSSCQDPGELQASAELALVQLMESGASAAQVLGRARVVPRLLSHIANGNASDALTAAVERFVAAQGAGRGAGGAAADGTAPAMELRRQDIKEVLRMLQAHSSNPQLQRLTAGILAWWAGSSDANRRRLSRLGLQAAVAAAARDLTGGTEGAEQKGVLRELLRIIHALSSGDLAVHELAPCVEPCLLIAADAAAGGDEPLAAAAAAALAACVEGGGGREVAAAVRGSAAEALMVRLWTDSGTTLKTQVAEVIGCLARHGALEDDVVLPWADRLLDTFCDSPEGGAAGAADGGASGGKGSAAGARGQGGKGDGGKGGGGGAGGVLSAVSSAAGAGASAVAGAARAVAGGTASVGSSIGSAAWYLVTLGGGSAAAPAAPAAPPTPPPAQPLAATMPLPSAPDPALRAACVLALTSLTQPELGPGGSGLRVTYRWLYRLLMHLAAPDNAQAINPKTPSPAGDGSGPDPLGHVSLAYARSVATNLDSAAAWASCPPAVVLDPQAMMGQLPPSTGSIPPPAQAASPVAAAAAAAAAPASKVSTAAGWGRSGDSSFPAASPPPGASGPPKQTFTAAPELAARLGAGHDFEEIEEYLLPHVDLSDPLGMVPDIVGRQVVVAQARNAARLRLLGASLAEKGACDAMEVINSIVAQDPGRQAWLHASGILPLLKRLTSSAAPSQPDPGPASNPDPALTLLRDKAAGTVALPEAATSQLSAAQLSAGLQVANAEPGGAQGEELALESADAPIDSDQAGSPGLGLKRHTACLLAMLALVPSAASDVRSATWEPWLQSMARDDDCRLASHATKALLHLYHARPGGAGVGAGPEPAGGLQAAGGVPVFGDMVHLLVPAAPHHWALARNGASREVASLRQVGGAGQGEGGEAATEPAGTTPVPPGAAASLAALESLLLSGGGSAGRRGEPEVDVVFVHGIRGGPFITWRKPGTIKAAAPAAGAGAAPAAPARGGNPRVPATSSRSYHLPLSACWPSSWLAEDFPQARLLTVEYAAPFTNYEIESLPLEATAARVATQLLAAGVGRRPVVFVCHSMGGLLVKEVLARAMAEAQHEEWASGADAEARPYGTLLDQTKAIVFFATPHFGSNLAAMGWRLHHIPGARPAPSLARLTPGPHLNDLNVVLQSLHQQRGVHVVSLLEGQPTEFGVLPRMTIVSPESGYPGFGERIVLADQDHVQLCKPAGKGSRGYLAVSGMLQRVLAALQAEASAGQETPALDFGAA